MTAHIERSEFLDVALLDQLWNFDDPAGSETALRDHLATLDPTSAAAAELTTQIARALGLQARHNEADALLDTISNEHPVVLARRYLERGRIRHSGGDASAAGPHFSRALGLAQIANNDYLAVDALHMLAIVDPEHAADWMREGLEISTTSSDPRTQRWQSALHNNLGWTLHDNEELTAALAQFEAAVAAYQRFGTPEQVHSAQWAVARCLRSLGRNEDALAIQERLAANDPVDPYVEEEIALLKHRLNNATERAG